MATTKKTVIENEINQELTSSIGSKRLKKLTSRRFIFPLLGWIISILFIYNFYMAISEGTFAENRITTLSLLLALSGGFLTYYHWRSDVHFKRAEFIKQLLTEISTDKNNMIQLFDYNDKIWYDENFHNSELEERIDHTLTLYSYICYLHNHRIISKNDFINFKYDVERIVTNSQFQSYCYNLYHFTKNCNLPVPFYELFEYAKERKQFNAEFWNIKSQQYPHYLI